jgi:predicted Rossmann-fold nucleotide-binding protein
MPPVNFHVVFIATSTDEKIRDLNLIASKKNLPLKFFNLRELHALVGVLHNTVEDGNDAEANAGLKLEGVKSKIEKCRDHPQAVEIFLRKHGIDSFDPARIWFGAEDSGVTLPKEIWENLPKKIFDAVPAKTNKLMSELVSRPGVETAPFLSATLGAENIQSLIEEGIKNLARRQNYFIDLSKLEFDDKSAIKMESMALYPDRDDPSLLRPHVITSEGNVTNSYASSPYTDPDKIGGHASNYDYIMPKRNHTKDKRTASEAGLSYIIRHSAREAAISDMIYQINHVSDADHQLASVPFDQRHDLETGIAKNPDPFTVGIMNIGNAAEAANMLMAINTLGYKNPRINHMQAYVQPQDENPPEDALLMDKATFYLSYPERMLAKSDGIVLLPDSVRTATHPEASFPDRQASLDEKLYTLNSLVVAKQLMPRDMKKSIVIINTDHSWDEAIEIHTKLANSQMTKDFNKAIAPQLEGVKITSNGYFDIINGGEYDAAIKAAAVLMKDKSLTYHRVESAPPQTYQEGPDCKDRRDLISIFCSASSENTLLNQHISEITSRYMEKGKGIISGGGDRYAMGAILHGAQSFRKKFRGDLRDMPPVVAISTQPIAASETEKGKLHDDYTYKELTDNIYTRMAKMLVTSEKSVVAPGGAGTMQEWMGFNLLKRKMPEAFGHKKLVIFDPALLPDSSKLTSLKNRVFDKVLSIYFKDEYHVMLTRRPNGHDIQIASTVDSVLNDGKKPAGPWVSDDLRKGGYSAAR